MKSTFLGKDHSKFFSITELFLCLTHFLAKFYDSIF